MIFVEHFNIPLYFCISIMKGKCDAETCAALSAGTTNSFIPSGKSSLKFKTLFAFLWGKHSACENS